MKSTFLRVVKVGGSLLDLPDLPERLRDWIAAQSVGHNVLLTGGGSLVDQVRRWNQQRPVAEEPAHWLCVDLVDATTCLLQAWMPELTRLDDDRQLCQRLGQPGITIFAPGRWLREAEPGLPGSWLPKSWETTSDAIAGRLAVALAADELVLLKSTLPDPSAGEDLAVLAAGGFVDLALARLAAELPPTRLIDLRSVPTREARIASTKQRNDASRLGDSAV